MAAKKTEPTVKPGISESKERTNFHIQADTIRNVKLIALIQDKTITELAETALQEFVERWVDQHGPLPKIPKQ